MSVWGFCYKYRQLSIITPSSNQLFKILFQNVMCIGLLMHNFPDKNWKLWSPEQEVENIVFIVFTTCCVHYLLFSLSLPFPWFTPPRGRVRELLISIATLCRRRAGRKIGLFVRHKHGKSKSFSVSYSKYARLTGKRHNLDLGLSAIVSIIFFTSVVENSHLIPVPLNKTC